MIPVAGSAYTYGYATLGEIFAWVIGWDLILEYAFSAATVASGWSANFVSLLGDFGIHLPPQIIETPGSKLVLSQGRWVLASTLTGTGIDPSTLASTTAYFNLPAFLVVLVVSAILIVGVRESARFNFIIVFVKLGTVFVFVILAGAFLWKNPSVRLQTGRRSFLKQDTLESSAGLVARGAAVIFFATLVSMPFHHCPGGAKSSTPLPIGTSLGHRHGTILYCGRGITDGHLHIPTSMLLPVAAATDVMNSVGDVFSSRPARLRSLSTVMLVTLMGQSRISMRVRMAFFAVGCRHPSALQDVGLDIIVGITPCRYLPGSFRFQSWDSSSIGTLLAFVIICAGVLILQRRPDMERPFRTPWSRSPILGIAISLFLWRPSADMVEIDCLACDRFRDLFSCTAASIAGSRSLGREQTRER
jgi:APA family basic amino acid/polyamine antiporter